MGADRLLEAQAMAVARARAEWDSWPAVDAAGVEARRAHALVYLSRGIGDQRADLGRYQWCGAFAAWCWGSAEAGLHPAIRRHLFPSTYRLGVWARQAVDPGIGWPHRHVRHADGRLELLADWRARLGGGPVLLRGADLLRSQPGDLVLVGAGPWGRHVTVAVSTDSDGCDTISGNAWGLWSDGRTVRRSSVARVRYRWGDVAAAIRPCIADLDQTVVYRP